MLLVTAAVSLVAPNIAAAALGRPVSATVGDSYSDLTFWMENVSFVSLLYSEALSGLPLRSSLSVSVDGVDVTISFHIKEGRLLELAIPPVQLGQTVLVSYTDPTSDDDRHAIQDLDGNDAPSFTDLPVTILPEVRVTSPRPRGHSYIRAPLTRAVIGEGDSGEYTVSLSIKPTGDVTVTPSVPSDSGVTVRPESLTFTTGNFATAQTVTRSASHDEDTQDATVTVAHTAAGGGYDTVAMKSFTLIVEDDDRVVELSTTRLTVTEGGSGEYTVRLAGAPAGDVTVTPSVPSGSGVTVRPESLTFTAVNYATAQAVAVSASHDEDKRDASATVTHTAAGGNFGGVAVKSVAVTVQDDDKDPPTARFSEVPRDHDGTWFFITITFSEAVILDPLDRLEQALAVTNGRIASAVLGLQDNSRYVDVRPASPTRAVTVTLVPRESCEAAGAICTSDGRLLVEEVSVEIPPALPTVVTGVALTNGPGANGTWDTGEVVEAEVRFSNTIERVSGTGGGPTLAIRLDGLRREAAYTGGRGTSTLGFRYTVTAADDGARTARVAANGLSPNGYSITDSRRWDAVLGFTTAPWVAIALGAGTLEVEEGRSEQYTVALASAPIATVTVTMTSNAAVSVNPMLLTFTEENYATAQTATVSAAEDQDTEDGSATVTHRGSGGNGVEVATLAVTVIDDDTAGVTLSRTTLDVDEGESATYTVKLDTEPTDAVTVTPVVPSDSGLTVRPESLTFTTGNYATAQTVTVTAGEDEDAEDGRATVTHAAAGGGYGGVSVGTVAVAVVDDDTAAIALGAESVGLVENQSAPYTVALESASTAAVTVAVMVSGGPGVSVRPESLTFTAGDYAVAQTVMVSAADDENAAGETATVTHRGSGGGYGAAVEMLAVTVTDDDTAGVTLGATRLTVPEGGSSEYTVRLATEPTGAVTVTPSVASDSGLSVRPESLTFTTGDYATARTVTVSAADDEDAEPVTASVTHTVAGGGYDGVTVGGVAVTVDDDDTAGVTLGGVASLTVSEGAGVEYTVKLDTEPTDAVTVTPSVPSDSGLTR